MWDSGFMKLGQFIKALSLLSWVLKHELRVIVKEGYAKLNELPYLWKLLWFRLACKSWSIKLYGIAPLVPKCWNQFKNGEEKKKRYCQNKCHAQKSKPLHFPFLTEWNYNFSLIRWPQSKSRNAFIFYLSSVNRKKQ